MTKLVDKRTVWIVGHGPYKVFNSLEHAKEFVGLCGDNRDIVAAELVTPNEVAYSRNMYYNSMTQALTGFNSPELGSLALNTTWTDINDPLVSPSIPSPSN